MLLHLILFLLPLAFADEFMYFPHAGARLANMTLIPGEFSPAEGSNPQCIIYTNVKEKEFRVGVTWTSSQQMNLAQLGKTMCNKECTDIAAGHGTTWMHHAYDCAEDSETHQCVLVQRVASFDMMPELCALKEEIVMSDKSHIPIKLRIPIVSWSEYPSMVRIPIFAQSCGVENRILAGIDSAQKMGYVIQPNSSSRMCHDPLYACFPNQEHAVIPAITWTGDSPHSTAVSSFDVGTRCADQKTLHLLSWIGEW